jgi:hypothetical protein
MLPSNEGRSHLKSASCSPKIHFLCPSDVAEAGNAAMRQLSAARRALEAKRGSAEGRGLPQAIRARVLPHRHEQGRPSGP